LSRVSFKAVVFDLDGTLIDTEQFYRAAFHATAREFGVRMPADLYATLVGLATSDRRPVLRRVFGSGFPVDEFIAAYYVQREAHLPARIPLCPGAAALLRRLNLPKAVATSASRRTALSRMKQAELIDHFPHIATRDDVRRGKPAPDTYLHAASLLGVAPAECLAVEDSSNGVTAAHRAGMRVAMVQAGKAQDTRSWCLAVVSRLDSLADLIGACSARNRPQCSYVEYADMEGRPVTRIP
jgi:HAD superfamily hydrolase (TIGR01509 family)